MYTISIEYLYVFTNNNVIFDLPTSNVWLMFLICNCKAHNLPLFENVCLKYVSFCRYIWVYRLKAYNYDTVHKDPPRKKDTLPHVKKMLGVDNKFVIN